MLGCLELPGCSRLHPRALRQHHHHTRTPHPTSPQMQDVLGGLPGSAQQDSPVDQHQHQMEMARAGNKPSPLKASPARHALCRKMVYKRRVQYLLHLQAGQHRLVNPGERAEQFYCGHRAMPMPPQILLTCPCSARRPEIQTLPTHSPAHFCTSLLALPYRFSFPTMLPNPLTRSQSPPVLHSPAPPHSLCVMKTELRHPCAVHQDPHQTPQPCRKPRTQ